MKFSRLSGGLAAACLLISAVASSASAQGARDAYGNPKAAPSPRPMGTVRRASVGSQPSYSTPASSSTSGVRFGFRGGLNLSDVQGDAVKSFTNLAGYAPDGTITRQMRPGFYAGVYATLPLGPSFAIEPGVSYSEKGTVLQGKVPVPALDFLNTTLTGTARLAYVDVPVLAKVFVTPGFYLYAGPQASFLVSGKARVEAGALGFTAYKQDFDISDQIRKVDFAAVAGLGYQFDMGLGVSAGYDYGLTSIDSGNRFDAQNRVIKVGLNYSF
ncbi:porin family protein [Hymenobacter sp. BT770]|uniref:porin family protein n=1 Tax=Hymenobacter sp. BT770 TaxID=2886942 RepID=UPI001D1304EB|nr:porin family protein [Hymenobacter sp. BT770]MCC3154115.1 PorT family protein [Hymenobacter sp. BT770]MDO3416259.1 porin family protein [Hymenobacter sp. BT770]